MVIRFLTKDLRIDASGAVLCEWASLCRRGAVQQIGRCRQNLISDVELKVGSYALWLEESTAEYVPTGRRAAFQVISPWMLDVSASDLKRGEASIALLSAQLLRVMVTREGIPAGREPLHFLAEAGSADVTSEVRTDENGFLVILGDPAELILAEGDDLIVGVEPFH